jgi:hypothetical protein
MRGLGVEYHQAERRDVSIQTIVERASTEEPRHRPVDLQVERLDRLIAEVEIRLEDQEAYVREVTLVAGSTAVPSFELQRLQLLAALLREGRKRLSDAASAIMLPAAPSASG